MKEEAANIEKEENEATMMFDMMQKQHQDELNQVKDINKQALEMVHHLKKNGGADDGDVQ